MKYFFNNSQPPHHHHHHHHHSSGIMQTIGTGLQAVNNVVTNAALNFQQNIHGSPLSSSINLSNYTLANSQLHNNSTHLDDTLENGESMEHRLESWLSIPNKRNIKKHGWKKLYVVLRKGKLFFYNSLKDNQCQEPYMTIDLE